VHGSAREGPGYRRAARGEEAVDNSIDGEAEPLGLGVFGASLFFGDSVITPAISVLSAIEGVKVVAPSLSDLVIPITVVIIVLLFQRLGTGTVGRLFGPAMGLWFTAIGLCGIAGIAGHPSILAALSPTYALGFLFGHFTVAFFSLAAVVLAVTGAEALYADMGHFGRAPITRVWLVIVFPALILCYLGQGALLLDHPADATNPFFLLVPHWARLPVVILAAAATVIASQAVITGAFSVARQAAQLGYLPRLRIAHTSEEQIGQVYVPWINWALLVGVVTLVLTFRSSASLAYAYGTAVTGTITITTLLFFYIAARHWHWRPAIIGVGATLLLTVDELFFSANLTKLTHGAWLPLLIGVTVFTVLTTWQRGREQVTVRRQADEGPPQAFIDELHTRKPPVSVETVPAPHVAEGKRIHVDALGHKDDRISFVSAKFGYMDPINVPSLLPLIRQAGLERPLDTRDVSYLLSTIDLHAGHASGLSRWRKRLFLATSQITADAADYFQLPRDSTVIMGSRIEI
jgi:KUP system potassium uptake protein